MMTPDTANPSNRHEPGVAPRSLDNRDVGARRERGIIRRPVRGGAHRWLLWKFSILILAFATATFAERGQSERQHTLRTTLQMHALGAALDEGSFGHARQTLNGASRLPLIIATAKGDRAPDNAEALAAMSAVATSDTLMVYLLNREGNTVACTPYGDGKTLTGKNYAFRPYFTQVLERSQPAFYSALGVTTGKRGMYISVPVLDHDCIAGVLVAKLDLAAVDLSLADRSLPAAIVSPRGVVFASNRAEWLYKTVLPMTEDERAALRQTKQFGDQALTPLEHDLSKTTLMFAGRVCRVERIPVNDSGWMLIGLFEPPPFGAVLFWATASLAWLILTLATNAYHFQCGLRESKERFALLGKHSGTVAWEVDENGLYTYVSHVAEHVFGYRSDEMVGQMHFYDLHPKAGREAFKTATLEMFARKERFVGLEGTVRTKDGRIMWVSTHGLPLLSGTGTLLGYCGSDVDITERRQAEEAVAANTAELEKSRRAALSMMEDAEAARKLAEAAEAELRESNAMMVDGLGREKRAAMELESAMEQLEAAKQDAEAASRSKSEFLANMSHEIRTPMTAILGYSETLLEDGDITVAPRGRVEAIHTIRRNGNHLLQIINDILDISKIEAGKLKVEHIQCSPVRLVADVKSLMQVRADAKNLHLCLEYSGVIPETIESDPTRLKQILVNLTGNAIKFTETGGVRLVTRFVNTDPIGGMGPAKPMLQFDVIDTGIGMTEEQTGRLFQAFAQADTSTTRKFGGTGLGLMISKRLSEMLGGTITVESKPGMGSTFRVTVVTGSMDGVKMLDDHATATCVRPETAAETKQEADKLYCRILLAEDGPDNQRLIAFVLKKAGADVTVVEDGKLAAHVALAALEESVPFDVILMDMQMPVMDGYEATRLLRQKGYTRPIIALTAHAMAGDRQECIDAGCDDYASKPIDRKGLIATIQKWQQKDSAATKPNASPSAADETADVTGA